MARKGAQSIEELIEPATVEEGRQGDSETGVTVAPAEEREKGKGEEKAGKEKATYSLTPRLRKLIDTVADELGMLACDLVEWKMTEALKGCSKPVIPEALRTESRRVKGDLSRRKKSAA